MKQSADVEVLTSLRHNRFIGRDDQHHKVEPVGAGEHVFDEALVTGHINKTESEIPDRKIGESDVDRYAALFFLFEPVGVDASERFDQCGLAVVDVAGGPDDDVLHGACSGVKIQDSSLRSQTGDLSVKRTCRLGKNIRSSR